MYIKLTASNHQQSLLANNMNIEYYKKSVYGNDMLYLADERQADLFRALTGRKTLQQGDMTILSELFGCQFTQILK